MASDISNLDLYKILGVELESTEKQIVKAYRKKALKCHPDKNPDNPAALEIFLQLSKALEVLTDAAARAAYDKIQKAKRAAEIRNQELNAKRRKLKSDLEARESASFVKKTDDAKAAANLAAEVERLRKVGSKLLEEEQERLREELKREKEESSGGAVKEESSSSEGVPRLKVKWKAKKGDETNGGYSEEYLRNAFTKYGPITVLLISKKKNGSAILEFESSHSGVLAVQNEIGLPDNPLTISWISGEPANTDATVHLPQNDLPQEVGAQQFTTLDSSERDFEDLVLMRMRQAQERKRLAEQISQEDEENGKSE